MKGPPGGVPSGHRSLNHAQAPAVLDHSCALPQGDGDARPALAGGAVGNECNLVVLDTGNMLHDAFAVRVHVSMRKVKGVRVVTATAFAYRTGNSWRD